MELPFEAADTCEQAPSIGNTLYTLHFRLLTGQFPGNDSDRSFEKLPMHLLISHFGDSKTKERKYYAEERRSTSLSHCAHMKYLEKAYAWRAVPSAYLKYAFSEAAVQPRAHVSSKGPEGPPRLNSSAIA